MNNMKHWDAMAQPPKSALKEILAGRLKGKSDINPQWRYQIMTEQFGPCGIGWKFSIIRLWQEGAPAGEVFALAEVAIMVRGPNGEWGEPIPGIGGSMLVALESKGLHANDEAYKMAVTDALGTAMKMLGVAADIYAGKWDGSKYRDSANTPQTGEPAAKGELLPYCVQHQSSFFRRNDKNGKIWYSHKIKGTTSYCNMETAKNTPSAPKAPPTSTPKPTDNTELVFQVPGDLAAAAYKLGIKQDQMLSILGVKSLSAVKDLTGAYIFLKSWKQTYNRQGPPS